MLDIVIVGAGGFGREVHQWADDFFPSGQYRIKGFLSSNASDLDSTDTEGPVLGDEDSYDVQENDRFVLAIGDIDARKRMLGKLKNKGARFVTLRHGTAVVADTARIGEGVIIYPFATVSNNVVLGDFAVLNLYASCGHDCKVGNCCVLSPYATLNGFAVLEDEVFLGTHATVAAYRRVGRGSKISANSVAMYDVPAHTLVYGVPGKHKTIFVG